MLRQMSIPALEAIIGYVFNDKEVLWRAMHAAGSLYGGVDGNKLMAMIGDTLLKLVLLDDLLPTGASRGSIDRTVSHIVSNQNLAEVCTRTSVARYINGNPAQPGEQSPKTKIATIEAILAAVFQDSGKSIESVRNAMAALGLAAPIVGNMG